MSARASRLSRAVRAAVTMLHQIAATQASTPESRALCEALEDRTLFNTYTGVFWSYQPGLNDYRCGPFYYTVDVNTCPPSVTVNDGNVQGYLGQGLAIDYGPVSESNNPVQYYSGQPVVFNADLQSDGFGGNGWSQTRSWSMAIGEGPLGPGWDITDWTHLIDVTQIKQTDADAPLNATDTIAVVETAGDQRWFDSFDHNSPHSYTERLGGQDKLLYDTTSKTFTLYDSTGGQTVYSAINGDGIGLFQSYTDSGGNTTTATYDPTTNRLTTLKRFNGSEYEKWDYSWTSMPDAAGDTVDRVTSVTLSRSSNGDSNYSPVRSVNYAYYGTSDAGGDQGYLKSATIEDANSNAIDVWAYRYYKSGETGGDPGDLKMVFNPQSHAAAVAAGVDPTTSIDASVKPYATNDFTYDVTDGNRVASEAVQGAGCSCSGNAGQGSYTYSYVGSSGFPVSTPPTYNQWQERTTVGTVDPNGGLQAQEVVYTNAYGQPMLDVKQQLGPASAVTSISGNAAASTEDIYTSGTFSAGDVVVVTGATAPNGWPADNGIFEVKSVHPGYIEVNNSTPGNDSTSTMYVQKITAQSASYYRYHDSPAGSLPDAEAGQLVLQADPSAVNIPMNLTATGYYDASQFGYVSYDFQYPDLVNFNTSTGLAAYLNMTTGLVNTFDSYFNENDIGWNFSGPAGVTSNNSAVSGTHTTTYGTQAGFVLQDGSISQTLSFATTGAYTLSFNASQRDNVSGSNETLTVLVDGSPAGTFTPASSYGTNTYTATFSIGTSGTHTITFAGGYTLSNSGALIDNVSLGGTGAPSLTDGSFEKPALVAGDYTYDPGGTTATSTTPGGAPGRFHDSFVQQGELGAGQTQETRAYVAQSVSNAAAYPLGSDTVYTGPDGTGALTTAYGYTWYAGTTQPELVTETDPAVTAAQNGPDTSVTRYKFYDQYGRVIWTKDGDGYVNYTAYDNGTGAVTKTIVDVDYNKLTSAEQASFNQTGWAQPTGGQNLVTITIPDGLGRPLAVIDPMKNVTVYAYNDANHESRVYPAWGVASQATGTGTATTLVDTNLSSTGSYVGQVLTILSGRW